MATIEIEVRLNGDNELILPDEVVKRLRLQPDNRLVIEFEEDGPDKIEIRPLLRSYRGILPGVYGANEEEVLEYIRSERASWDQ